MVCRDHDFFRDGSFLTAILPRVTHKILRNDHENSVNDWQVFKKIYQICINVMTSIDK